MPKPAEVNIDPDTLSKQDNLTEEQQEAVALQALQEMNQDDSKDKKKKDQEADNKAKEEGAPKEETALSDEELLSASDEELSEEQKTKKVQLVEEKNKQEEERLLNAKDEDLEEEDKAKKAEIVKAREESKGKAAEQEIADFAKENNITVEEARTELESIGKIQEKYKSDPKQLAKAYLHSQREYIKLQEEAKKGTGAKPSETEIPEVSEEAIIKFVEDGKLKTNKGEVVTKEMTIEAYRKLEPDLTEAMDDDKVFRLAVKAYKIHLDKTLDTQRSEISTKAKEKRATILDSLPEEDKQFIPALKPLIEKLTDSQLMHEGFSLDTYVTYAKGQAYSETIKRLEQEKKDFSEKEYKRGLEQAKILGEKRPGGGSGGPPKGKDIVLTEDQKKRAREMFDSPDISEEVAYKQYKDFLKETNQV